MNDHLAPQIVTEVVRQQDKMGWPEYVPHYAEVPDAKGKIYVYEHTELTVAQCEQLVEHHSRKAHKAMENWQWNGSRHSLQTAGRNILYARLYRCRYLQLIGKTDSTEADMPFPFERSRR